MSAPRVYLNRAEILTRSDRKIEELEVPEWESWVRIAEWDGNARWRVMQASPRDGRPAGVNLWALVAVLSLVDEHGTALYSDEDIPAMAKKNAKALDRIFSVAFRLNGLDAGAPAALGNDSAPTGNGASTSNSPAISG